jgi:SOS-response transcriptional repressor LexA
VFVIAKGRGYYNKCYRKGCNRCYRTMRTLEESIGACMTEKQRTVFLVIDEYWRNYGYGPSIDDIMFHTGDRGRGNVHRVVKKLCELKICKRAKNSARSVRPSYLKLRNLP